MRKILVSAFGCWPGRGSELGVGWEWSKAMAEHNELHVITIRRSRQSIEEQVQRLPQNVQANLHFYYFDYPEKIIRLLPAPTQRWYPYYTLWQAGILPLARKIIRHVHPDYVMSLTFGSVWLPTFLPLISNITFIWGPVGGTDSVPRGFLDKDTSTNSMLEWLQKKRGWLTRHMSIIPTVRLALKKSAVILTRTEGNFMNIPQKYRSKAKVILETGINLPALPKREEKKKSGNSIRIVTTGRLIKRKNLSMAIDAFSRITGNVHDVYYDIIGGGPEEELLRKQIYSLHLEGKIHIVHDMPHDELMALLPGYDIFLFPSLLEGGSWSLMEAMGYGLPVVCIDTSGMHVITDDESAIRIAPTSRSEATEKMADALLRLINDREMREQMGRNAARRIKDCFSWKSKGAFMDKLFEELESRQAKSL